MDEARSFADVMALGWNCRDWRCSEFLRTRPTLTELNFEEKYEADDAKDEG
jgi:hypothetical protein